MDDRRDGVVEGEATIAEESTDRARERVRGQWPGGDHGWTFRELRTLFTHDLDAGLGLDRGRHGPGEQHAIDSQGGPGRDASLVGRREQDGPQRAHLPLELPMRVGDGLALERVGTDQLTQPVGLVRLRLSHGAHLHEPHGKSESRQLERGFAACEPTTHHRDRRTHFFFRPRPFLPPPRAALSAIIWTAVSRSISSGSVPFGRVAFTLPSVT